MSRDRARAKSKARPSGAAQVIGRQPRWTYPLVELSAIRQIDQGRGAIAFSQG